MPRYFVQNDCVKDGSVRIVGPTVRHIAVSRRAKSGDILEVADESSNTYEIKLQSISNDIIVGEILSTRPAQSDPGLKVTLFQAVVKDGMDEAIDAATELGVDRIVPVITEHTIVRLDAERAANRQRRWQEIALSAAEVSYRDRIPVVEEPTMLAQALIDLPREVRILGCAMAGGSTPLTTLKLSGTESVALIVGPEGGLSAAELEAIVAAGGDLVHLGPRVLRGRIAASHALAILMSITGDLERAVEQDRMH